MSTRWQYQMIEIKPGFVGGVKREALQEEMNRQGQQGWELVQVLAENGSGTKLMVFKRQG